MLCIDEELRTTAVRSAGVGHGQGADFIGELCVFRVFIRNVPSAVSHDVLAVAGGVFSTAFWASSTGSW